MMILKLLLLLLLDLGEDGSLHGLGGIVGQGGELLGKSVTKLIRTEEKSLSAGRSSDLENIVTSLK